MQQRIFTSENYALDWARNHLPFDSSELVSRAPWGMTYKLSGRSGRAYLKLLPPALSNSSVTAPALARRVPENLPEVISKDDELGLLLVRHHRGRRLDRDPSDSGRRSLLQAYAGIQAEVRQQPDLLGLFPTLDLESLVRRLLEFLDPSAPRDESNGKVGSVYFIGRTRSRRYHDPLSKRSKLIEKQILAALELPATVNHCDLRLKNATLTSSNAIILGNWDDATVGPAGLSLHALFDGCATPVAILAGASAGRGAEGLAEKRYVLDAYIDALVQGGYASRGDLESFLPGAICAGAIRQLLWYADYPDDSRRYRRRVRRIITKRLSDLLDFCDLVALGNKGLALASALEYHGNGRSSRAESLLCRYVSIDPNDPPTHAALARVLHVRGKRRRAIAAFRDAIELNPDRVDLLNDYGVALLEELRLDDAITTFRRGLTLDASNVNVTTNLDRACRLRDCLREADDVDTMPTLPVSDAERASGVLRPESVALGATLFEKHGTLLIENAFDADMIQKCDEYFVEKYADYFGAKAPADALPIGDKRLQITFGLEGPFNNPDLYGNPFVLALMKALLGRKFFIGCTVCAASLPGARDQHLHKDHRALFTKDADDPPMALPPFAITMMVPLVPLDELTGTTTVRKGSHLKSRRASAKLPQQVPIVPIGSCFLMDLRLSHAGLGNKTHRVRPILNMVYQQPWFADNKNFTKQAPIRIPRDEFRKIPGELRRLFGWTKQPGPDV